MTPVAPGARARRAFRPRGAGVSPVTEPGSLRCNTRANTRSVASAAALAAVVAVVALPGCDPRPGEAPVVDTRPYRIGFVRPNDSALDPLKDATRDSLHLVIAGDGDDVVIDIPFAGPSPTLPDVPLGAVHIEASVFDFAQRLVGFGALDSDAQPGDLLEVPLLPPLLYVVDNYDGLDTFDGRGGLNVVDLRGRAPIEQSPPFELAPTIAQRTDVIGGFGAYVTRDGRTLVVGARAGDHAVVHLFDTFDIAADPVSLELQTDAGVLVPLGDGRRALVGPQDGPVAWIVDIDARSFVEQPLPVGAGSARCDAGDADAAGAHAFLGCELSDGPHLLHLDLSGDPVALVDVQLGDGEVRDLRVLDDKVYVAHNQQRDVGDSDAVIEVYDPARNLLGAPLPIGAPGRGKIRRVLRAADGAHLLVTLEPIYGSDNGCCAGFALVDPVDGAVGFLTDDGSFGMSSATTAPGQRTFAGMSEYGNDSDGDIFEVRGTSEADFGVPMRIGQFYVDNVVAIAAPFGARL